MRDLILIELGGVESPQRFRVAEAGVEVAGILVAAVFDPLVQLLFATPELIAQAQQAEGWMVAIGIENTVQFRGIERIAVRNASRSPDKYCPCGQFHLQDDSGLVGSGEGSFRRTVGVIAHMIQAIGSDGLIDVAPTLNVHGRVAGQWEGRSVVRAAEERRAAVESELRTLDTNLADAEFYGGVVAIRSA